MRVKVGDTWHDSKDVPITVELDTEARVAIVGMPGRQWQYSQFPDSMDFAARLEYQEQLKEERNEQV